MPWDFEDDSPIYLQIVEHFKAQIASGALKGGDRLATVRELALEAGVNPNTMQKALAELERQGLLYTRRTAGRYVSERISRKELQKEQAWKLMKEFTDAMITLGFDKRELPEAYREYLATYENDKEE